MSNYIAGKYLRLSDADRDKNGHELSNSIENQNLTIDRFLENHQDIKVYETYIDDGKTGMNYERYDFKRMMRDIDHGKINTVIVKDLSRIGREHCDTITLLKRTFPLKNIRFIAVVDNIDLNGNYGKQSIDVPIKVVINDIYSQNISNQVRNALSDKMETGKFIGAFTSYGYVKDPNDKNHLLIDPEAAEIVRRIFDEFLSGKSISIIADELNAEHIYSPLAYKRFVQGLNFSTYYSDPGAAYWTYSTIKRMLKKRIYTGDMVQHTTETIAYNIKKKRRIPKEEYCIVEGKHEAIVEKDTFQKVQDIMGERFYKQRNTESCEENPYKGIFFCGDCDRAMNITFYATKEKPRVYAFRCGQHAREGKNNCSSHFISKAKLDKIVLEEIRKNINKAKELVDMNGIFEMLKSKKNDSTKERLKTLEKRKVQLINEKKHMLSNLSKKIIAEEDFSLYNTSYIEEMEKIEQGIISLSERYSEKNRDQSDYKEWVSSFLEYKDITALDRNTIVSLIEKIKIYENRIVEIIFRFKNPFES